MKTCAVCFKNFIGGVKAKHCIDCVKGLSRAELYHTKKPIPKCATCDQMAKNSLSKYCLECTPTNKELCKTYMENKRKDPEFVQKERERMDQYCEDKGISLEELRDAIFEKRENSPLINPVIV